MKRRRNAKQGPLLARSFASMLLPAFSQAPFVILEMSVRRLDRHAVVQMCIETYYAGFVVVLYGRYRRKQLTNYAKVAGKSNTVLSVDRESSRIEFRSTELSS